MPDYTFVPFVLTKHATERMRLRGITTGMIAQALAKPNSTQPGRDNEIYSLQKWARAPCHCVLQPPSEKMDNQIDMDTRGK
jgi:hypothetical protein